MELYDRSAWTGNDKISGNAPHAHKEVNSHFVHPWNAARQGKDRRGQIANRRSTVGGRWNGKNRPRRLFSCAPLVQGQPLSRLTPPAFLNSAWSHHCARELACGTPCFIGLTSRCFVPQFAIVALLCYRLQRFFAHWTSASPVPATGGGEAPSLSRSPLGFLTV